MQKEHLAMNVKRGGRGMTKYVIIVAVIVFAAMMVVTLYGDNLRQLFGYQDPGGQY